MSRVGISSKFYISFLNDILNQTCFKLIQSNYQLRPLLRDIAFKSACKDVQMTFWKLKNDECPSEFIWALWSWIDLRQKKKRTCLDAEKCRFKTSFFQSWHKEHVTSIKASNFLFPFSPLIKGRLKETMQRLFIITPAWRYVLSDRPESSC